MKEQTSGSTHRLEEANAAALRRLWASSKGTKPPKTFTARLMRLVLAWNAQSANTGGETAQVRRSWNRIVKSRSGGGDSRNNVYSSPYPGVGCGTRILKDWGGTTQEVLVTEGGATWNGESYTSLSAVARAMTGTNRNGPKFFGLRESTKS